MERTKIYSIYYYYKKRRKGSEKLIWLSLEKDLGSIEGVLIVKNYSLRSPKGCFVSQYFSKQVGAAPQA